MRCDLDKVPSVGLFGMVVHQGGLRAQKMFDKYGLNKSQAGILFMLHHEEAVSQKPLSQKELAKKLNVTAPSITSAIQKMDEIMFRGISQEEKLLLRRIMIQIFDNLKEEPRFHTSGESKTER